MKKYFYIILKQVKEFFLNPFWVNVKIICFLVISLGINAVIWILFFQKYHELIGISEILYPSEVLILNVFLGNIIYKREPLASAILMGIAAFIQILFLVLLKFLAIAQTF